MLLIVGLGNPGPRHAGQRHNIGFMAVDALAEAQGFAPWRKRFDAETAEGRLGRDKVMLIKPQTFMNESGRAVGAACRFFKLAAEQVIVFYDELDLAPGKLRLRQGGGAAGHNGIRSITAHIGADFWRVRLGIGHPGDKALVLRHVLGDFAKAEQAWLVPLLDALAIEAPLLAGRDKQAFASRVAQRLLPPGPAKQDQPSGDKGDGL